jgi:hypothetical protein
MKKIQPMQLPPGIKIKEKSLRAKMAALKLKAPGAAIVFGNTIYLSGVSRQTFLQNAAWVRHEIKHAEQFKKNGFALFICLYLAEWIRKGYYNNRYEIEARAAE